MANCVINFERMVKKLFIEFSGNEENKAKASLFQQDGKDSTLYNIASGIKCYLVHEHSKMFIRVSGAVILVKDGHPLVVWERNLHCCDERVVVVDKYPY